MHNLGMGTFLSMPSFDLNLGRKDGRHVFWAWLTQDHGAHVCLKA
jgi:hypothetical protein